MNLSLKKWAYVLLSIFVISPLFAQVSPVKSNFQKWESIKVSQEKASRVSGTPYVISIRTKEDLNSLNGNVKRAIKNGKKRIEVRLGSGVYYYDRLTVYLCNINAQDVSLSIIGEPGTVLVAGGKDFRNSQSLLNPSTDNIYLDSHGELIDCYREVKQASSSVEVLNEKRKECRMRIQEDYPFLRGLKIQLSEWYLSPEYEVTKIKGGYVYFTAGDLTYDKAKKCYNVQYDNAIGSVDPRYRFLDPSIPARQKSTVHECSVSQFMTLYRLKLKSISISGIQFVGCAKGSDSMCHLREVEAERILVENCDFSYSNTLLFKLKNTNNFVFRGNKVKDCYYGAINSAIDCANTIVKDNTFYRMGKGWTNSTIIACHGADFVVSDNKFEDFGYSAVSTGYNHKWGSRMVTGGVIENNEIWYGDEYFSNCEKYTLMDGGAVYVSTLSDNIIIRYNYIHDYRGIRSNRAIYCDDGAMNVKIYGNVIRNIPGADAVFSWRAKSINSKVSGSNDGICFYYNVIWGSYKLDERPNSSCIHGKNLILYANGEPAPKNELVNFKYQERDAVYSGAQVADGKLVVPQSAMKELKQFPTYEKMRQWLK